MATNRQLNPFFVRQLEGAPRRIEAFRPRPKKFGQDAMGNDMIDVKQLVKYDQSLLNRPIGRNNEIENPKDFMMPSQRFNDL